ncbi:unnamed protein product [Effrenium voratum]|nr:unnamed protein product [Effrenium voratum]
MAKQSGWISRALSTVTSRSRKTRNLDLPFDSEEDNAEAPNEPRVPALPGCKSTALFDQDSLNVPCVGGCVDLQEHSKHLLPEEVVLFAPREQEIFADQGRHHGTRLIFLNTELSQAEVTALVALRKEWCRRHGQGRDELPEFIRLCALRILQHKKFDVAKSLDLIQTCLEERVKRLPLREEDILPDLSCGAMYWHGRDRRCRPCLVVRIERFAELIKERERCVNLTIFVLEYAIRFAMVPGRVENWVVLVDFENASDVVSFYQLPTMCFTAKAISQTLESVYCCRMVWVKLVNLPSMLSRIVQSVIPAEKKKKVCVVEDPQTELLKDFEPSQLEARYGGSRPDLQPHQTYPFHFYPGCRGTSGQVLPSCESGRSSVSSSSGSTVDSETEASLQAPTSLHNLTSRSFHEGELWDTSVPERWVDRAADTSLAPDAAQALSSLRGNRVEPCCTLEQWKELPCVQARNEVCTEPPTLGWDVLGRTQHSLNRKNIISL